ncbi:RHS repeat-associated core domain-containing protein [Pseudomonas sp. SWRI100]|uniref:RHS repeat-associated core domain-containing protein n=1 Tax=Pseudomonas TaxID=286 RepID=UPI001644B9B6|nr:MULTISPECIES: RHS repeat-associated core domain-containing protein [Pseudomonas]MBC3499141.1 RHS repeat-associated core domain-containing protein [Pseudomonas sp. SWRI67]MBV4525702.1 RHS repeat-associated core domain-containing protein [Pseudomonas kermanshahensis]
MDTRNAYSPYGYRSDKTATAGALGFNGQFFHAALECYALGNGHRIYNPRMMRFISPDALSPFLKGGINAYTYCLNDPVNGLDPSGKTALFKTAVQGADRLATLAASYLKFSVRDGMFTNLQHWLLGDEMSYAKLAVKASYITYREMESKASFSQLNPSKAHKFVFTTERKVVVFSGPVGGTMPSHASLGEYSGLGYGTKGLGEKAISAGYIIRDKEGNISINNHSGHFQPDLESLNLVKEHLNKLGVDVTLIRTGFST